MKRTLALDLIYPAILGLLLIGFLEKLGQPEFKNWLSLFVILYFSSQYFEVAKAMDIKKKKRVLAFTTLIEAIIVVLIAIILGFIELSPEVDFYCAFGNIPSQNTSAHMLLIIALVVPIIRRYLVNTDYDFGTIEDILIVVAIALSAISIFYPTIQPISLVGLYFLFSIYSYRILKSG